MNRLSPQRLQAGWWWLMLPLAGCLSPPLEPPALPVPRVATLVERHLVTFPGIDDQPDAQALARLDRALDGLANMRELELRVSAPARGPSPQLVRQRVSSVASHLRAHHPEFRIVTATTDRLGPADVTVDMHALAATVASCPDWSRDPAADTANRAMSNLGCATAHNLGLMLDDPRDLDHGAALAGADGTREAEAVVRYRTDKVKTLQNELGQP